MISVNLFLCVVVMFVEWVEMIMYWFGCIVRWLVVMIGMFRLLLKMLVFILIFWSCWISFWVVFNVVLNSIVLWWCGLMVIGFNLCMIYFFMGVNVDGDGVSDVFGWLV